ncbi:hypothetical protein PsYK624_146120 [Phanerochaete sordida]|uniref:Ribonuclease H1 N-terminal domain-containing protein n=1 Tax=Phanerochaete sordida TaxID=48140 RepID=A0A9P3LKB7_9APHY|nr:hypothetical protein PsYK624_146120 [Phanerochaete sordida]
MSKLPEPPWLWTVADWPEPGYFLHGWILNSDDHPDADLTVQPLDEPWPTVIKHPDVFVVFVGREPGLYYRWKGARKQVNNFRGAKYIRCRNLKEAQIAWHIGPDKLMQRDTSPTPESWGKLPYELTLKARVADATTDWPQEPFTSSSGSHTEASRSTSRAASPAPAPSQAASTVPSQPASPAPSQPASPAAVRSASPAASLLIPSPSPIKADSIIDISSDEEIPIRKRKRFDKGKRVIRLLTSSVRSSSAPLYVPSSPLSRASSASAAPSTPSSHGASSRRTKTKSAVSVGGALPPPPSTQVPPVAGPSSAHATGSSAPEQIDDPFVYVVIRGREPGVYETHALALARCGPVAEGKIVSARSMSRGYHMFARQFMKNNVVVLE